MQPQAFYRIVAKESATVDGIIRHKLQSQVPLAATIGEYLISAGGKRLRPLLVLLTGKALNYQQDNLAVLAATIEFLHTAALLHDDVVDESSLRRGRSTANAQWGNASSVLVGDFLYSRAFEMMVELGSLPVMGILAHATRVIAEGEVLQLSKIQDTTIDEATYMHIIRGKTAMLFEASTHSAAVLSGSKPEACEHLRQFGDHLGIAFQLMDDWLDYAGDAQSMGKNLGDDLAEGKVTLPLIYTLAHGTKQQADLIQQAIESAGSKELTKILQALTESGALDYTKQQASHYAECAAACLQTLPRSPYRDALLELSQFAVTRTN